MRAILGSGISSIMLARIMLNRGIKGSEILILENSSQYGGAFGQLIHDADTKFDIGMHTIQLTSDSEIDEIFLEIVGKKNWSRYTPPSHDLSGTIIGRKIFENGPYFDLEFFDPVERAVKARKLRQHIEKLKVKKNVIELKRTKTSNVNAKSYLKERFGSELSESTYISALIKRYGINAEDLSVMATKLTPMSRIFANFEFEEEELKEDSIIRDIIAWHNQRSLPAEHSTNRDVYYPNDGGIKVFIDEMLKNLSSHGVILLRNSKILNLQIIKNRIVSMVIESDNQVSHQDVNDLCWTGNLSNLIKIMGISYPVGKTINPMQTVVATLKSTKEKFRETDCMYHFAYLNAYGLYRVNNYSAYKHIRQHSLDGCLSLEYIISRNKKLEKKNMVQDLCDIGILTAPVLEDEIVLHELVGGHPYPSLENELIERQQHNIIEDQRIQNLHLFGTSMSNSRFFQKDILLHLKQLMLINE